MNKDKILEKMMDYLNQNRDIFYNANPNLVFLNNNKMIEKTQPHGGMLIFRLNADDIEYNPHRFKDNHVKELSLLISEYPIKPIVPKSDLMFWTGFEML